MKKLVATHVENYAPSSANNIAGGYALGQEWFNPLTGKKYWHKANGIWQEHENTVPIPGIADKGIIIPLYLDPIADSGQDAAEYLVSLKAEHPDVAVIAIVNPASGPGTAATVPYTTMINTLRLGGIKVIGYVPTDYYNLTTVTLAEIHTDIDRWASFYDVDGIFFDEMGSSPTLTDEYTALKNYALAAGHTITVGNPGAALTSAWFTANVFDTYVIYENAGPPLESYLDDYDTMTGATPQELAVLVHGQSAWNATTFSMIMSHVKWIYITHDALVPDPWDELSVHIEEMFIALGGVPATPVSSGEHTNEILVFSYTVDNTGTPASGKAVFSNLANPYAMQTLRLNKIDRYGRDISSAIVAQVSNNTSLYICREGGSASFINKHLSLGAVATSTYIEIGIIWQAVAGPMAVGDNIVIRCVAADPAIPNLQQVTDAGAVTTHSIEVAGVTVTDAPAGHVVMANGTTQPMSGGGALSELLLMKFNLQDLTDPTSGGLTFWDIDSQTTNGYLKLSINDANGKHIEYATLKQLGTVGTRFYLGKETGTDSEFNILKVTAVIAYSGYLEISYEVEEAIFSFVEDDVLVIKALPSVPTVPVLASGTFTPVFIGVDGGYIGYSSLYGPDPYIYLDGTATYTRVGNMVTLNVPCRGWNWGAYEFGFAFFHMELPFPSVNAGTTSDATGMFTVKVASATEEENQGYMPGTVFFIEDEADVVKFYWRQDWMVVTDTYSKIYATITYEVAPD